MSAVRYGRAVTTALPPDEVMVAGPRAGDEQTKQRFVEHLASHFPRG